MPTFNITSSDSLLRFGIVVFFLVGLLYFINGVIIYLKSQGNNIEINIGKKRIGIGILICIAVALAMYVMSIHQSRVPNLVKYFVHR